VKGPCQTESAYFCIKVIGDTHVRTLILDNLSHSAVDLDDHRHLYFPYVVVFAATMDAAMKPGRPIRALHIGGGAFTMPLYIAATRPGSTNTVFEIDPAVVDTAKEKFGVRTGPQLRVKEGDARLSVAAEPPHTYDIIVGDAFSSRSVPWHLTTKEFLTDVRGLLRPGGAYMMNIIDAGFRFVRAEAATMRAVFGSVTLFESGHNLVLVGTERPLDPGRLRRQLRLHGAPVAPITAAALSRLIGDAQVLTDDFAPVDQLLK
jgi:hypothetical protein